MSGQEPIRDQSLQTPSPVVPPEAPPQQLYTGEVIYILAFDIAYEMKRQAITTLLGQPVSQFSVDASKRTPKAGFFYRSQMVRLLDVERMSPRGVIRMARSVKILPVGAISITVRIPFEIHHLEELVPLHAPKFSDGQTLTDLVRQWAQEIRDELRPLLIRPSANLGDEEAYTVFCIDAPIVTREGKIFSGESWLMENRRRVAALLTEEDAPQRLSEQEAVESTNRYLSYYDQDLVVPDWDAALIIDEPRYRDEVIYIMELANLQLAELEAYDKILDGAVETAYRDVSTGNNRSLQQLRNWRVQAQLQELRVDMARVTDELSNITKFFGDWHLARIYQAISSRFHLSDWRLTVEDKLKTLDEIYQLLRAEQNYRIMLVLEILIVLLFVADIVVLLFPK